MCSWHSGPALFVLPAPLMMEYSWHLAAPRSWGSRCVYYYLYDNNTAAGCTRTPIQRVPERIAIRKGDKKNQSHTILIPLSNPKMLFRSLCRSYFPQRYNADYWKNLCISYFCLNLLHATHLVASIMHALLCCKQQKILTGRYLHLFPADGCCSRGSR